MGFMDGWADGCAHDCRLGVDKVAIQTSPVFRASDTIYDQIEKKKRGHIMEGRSNMFMKFVNIYLHVNHSPYFIS